MVQIVTEVLLDEDQLTKLRTFFLYRSEEDSDGARVISGIYIPTSELGADPPGGVPQRRTCAGAPGPPGGDAMNESFLPTSR
jgi:hypothetical protein